MTPIEAERLGWEVLRYAENYINDGAQEKTSSSYPFLLRIQALFYLMGVKKEFPKEWLKYRNFLNQSPDYQI